MSEFLELQFNFVTESCLYGLVHLKKNVCSVFVDLSGQLAVVFVVEVLAFNQNVFLGYCFFFCQTHQSGEFMRHASIHYNLYIHSLIHTSLQTSFLLLFVFRSLLVMHITIHH